MQERLLQRHAEDLAAARRSISRFADLLERGRGSSGPRRGGGVRRGFRRPAPRRSRPRFPTGGWRRAPCRRSRRPQRRCCGDRGRRSRRWRRICRPKPLTKPVAMLPFLPCRSTTAMRMRSRAGSGRLSPSSMAISSCRCFGDDLAFEDADHVGLGPVGTGAEILGLDLRGLDGLAADGRDQSAARRRLRR